MMDQYLYDKLAQRPSPKEAPDLPTGKGTRVLVIGGRLWRNPCYSRNIDNTCEVPSLRVSKEHPILSAGVLSILTGMFGVAPDTRVEYVATSMGYWDNTLFSPETICNNGDSYRQKLLRLLDQVKKSGSCLREKVDAYGKKTFFPALDHAKQRILSGDRIDAISMSQDWAEPHDLKSQKERLGYKVDMSEFYWSIKAAFAERADAYVGWFKDKNVPLFCPNTPLSPNGTSPVFFFCGPDGPLMWGFENLSMQDRVALIRSTGQIGIPIQDRLLACASEDEVCDVGNLLVRRPGGGLGWATPYVAGMFLLAREKLPDITLDQFVPLARQSGVQTDFGNGIVLPVVNLAAYGKAVAAAAARNG